MVTRSIHLVPDTIFIPLDKHFISTFASEGTLMQAHPSCCLAVVSMVFDQRLCKKWLVFLKCRECHCYGGLALGRRLLNRRTRLLYSGQCV